MPLGPINPDGAGFPTSDPATFNFFGVPTPPPPAPAAQPTLNSAPTVSSTPSPGQGIALDSAGRLSVVVSFMSVVTADPSGTKRAGEFWFRADTGQLCVCTDGSTIKRVTLT